VAKLKLRRFLYLDGKLTDEFLAQVEGGLYDEESQSAIGRAERGVKGNLGVGPLSAGGSRGSADEEERARVIRQTQESAFSRLAKTLEENESVQWLESLDQEIWDQLERGEVLEVECDFSVPPLMKLLVTGAHFESIAELMKATGEQMEEEAVQGFAALGAIAELFQSIPIFGRAAGAEDFKFVAPTLPEHYRVALDQLDGSARLYCTLDRKLGQNEQFSIVDSIPAIRNLPNREEIEESLDEIKEIAGEPVTAPAAVVTPIAIFR
jgi:hypothetical protein